MASGSINLIFHSHLPWVLNHGKWPHGEDWLFEAMAECYIPILKMSDELILEGISPKYTIGFSPVLCEQLVHPSLFKKFSDYCHHKIEYARRDEIKFINENQGEAKINMSKFWQNFYQQSLSYLENCHNHDILDKFRELQDNGHIEIMTCGLTHAYLPLVGSDINVEFQVRQAVENYKKHFGREPKGTWLPECAYRPAYEWKSAIPIEPFNKENYRFGLEELLHKYNLHYFITDQKNLEHSKNIGDFEGNIYSELTPYKTYKVVSMHPKVGGLSNVFTRNLKLSMQVWSGEEGYPGEPNYLDFHKKEGGSMLRYWRVTDIKLDMQFKDLYKPEWTYDKTELQAHHFIKNLENSSGFYADKYSNYSTVALPFDTELFGHWWFEGPDFLKKLIRGIYQSPHIESKTCFEQLPNASGERIHLPESSWGKKNDHSVWMNEATKWCWERCYDAEKLVIDIVSSYKDKSPSNFEELILNQLIRSLQLLLSSDWEFLIENESAVDYSEMRVANHFSDIQRLVSYLLKIKNEELTESDNKDLKDIIERDSPFKEINYKTYL